MAVDKIILFYAFAPVADPTAVRLWQTALSEKLHLTGRVIVAPQGINATLGGRVEDLKQYLKTTRQYPGFRALDVKWSDGSARDFPRLSVKERPELVAFGAPEEIVVDANGVVNGGRHLAPQEVNDLVEALGEDVVFFDGRNAFEAQIGKFDGAIVPDTRTTHDFIRELDSGKYDHLKDKHIISYCTGGVRCEILSVLMKNRGFDNVYQVAGGIVRYGEQFGTKGLWKGPLYVFDRRMVHHFDGESLTLGRCTVCEAPTEQFLNCADPGCKRLRLYCGDHAEVAQTTVCADCTERSANVTYLKQQ